MDFTKEELAEIQESYEKLPNKVGSTRRKVVEKATFFRQHRPVERGLLVLYITANKDEDDKTLTYGLEGNEVVGFLASFPASKNAADIEYVVNQVYMDEE